MPKTTEKIKRVFEKYQSTLLPITSQYLGPKNLDIGCGTGIVDLIHKEKLNIEPHLCDVVDMRVEEVKDFPFQLIKDGFLPYEDEEFNSSYLQYVLHHVESREEVQKLISEAFRVSERVIIVEEVLGEKTDIEKAKEFDQKINSEISGSHSMLIFNYFSAEDIEDFLADSGHKIIEHVVLSNGSEDDGFLETHVFVAE